MCEDSFDCLIAQCAQNALAMEFGFFFFLIKNRSKADILLNAERKQKKWTEKWGKLVLATIKRKY